MPLTRGGAATSPRRNGARFCWCLAKAIELGQQKRKTNTTSPRSYGERSRRFAAGEGVFSSLPGCESSMRSRQLVNNENQITMPASAWLVGMRWKQSLAIRGH
jgi:hypothetical protein